MNQNSIVFLIRKTLFIFFAFIVVHNFVVSKPTKSMELNLLCIMNDNDIGKSTVKDLILQINTESNKVKLGGLVFTADDLKLTETNLTWEALNVPNLYPDSSGYTSGTLGRFSGELNLFFKHKISKKKLSLNYKCEKYKLRNRKF